MPVDAACPVLENRDLGGGYFLTTIESARIAADARPGQFVMAGSPDPSEILLRRPFSICLTSVLGPSGAASVSLLYRVVGRGTAYLARLRRGESPVVLGPLGRGFSSPRSGESAVIVAGGVGIAAFPFFVEALLAGGCEPALLYGGRTGLDLPLLGWFRERLGRVEVTTDDGSAGEHGLVTAPLERTLSRPGGRVRVYTCGPTPMMRKVAEIALRLGAACEVALETPMACGYGVCVGCVVEARAPEGEYGRFRRVCVDGPVFDATEVRW
jgi:dihydroorotate dehydrogenase electron transfer subunit